MNGGVGYNLREARGRRKLSLDEVEATTKIRTRYLQAIEDEDWDQLPSETYARAFIRTYAALLGLDGDRLAEEQRQAQGAVRPGERLPWADPKPRRVPPRLITAAVLALVMAALLAVGLSTGGGSDEPAGKAGQRHPTPHVGQAVPVR